MKVKIVIEIGVKPVANYLTLDEEKARTRMLQKVKDLFLFNLSQSSYNADRCDKKTRELLGDIGLDVKIHNVTLVPGPDQG